MGEGSYRVMCFSLISFPFSVWVWVWVWFIALHISFVTERPFHSILIYIYIEIHIFFSLSFSPPVLVSTSSSPTPQLCPGLLFTLPSFSYHYLL
ncbi:hypothetical protein I7I50_02162 [Histoplasma capsulatum G186AR]|uniref:Uncharacterized protein n=1 Tax=Ajellomyces capsulatus TaxID=5037 RepID=A0A8H8CU23_AJECA|nr:hypothetical protein I7I52_12376 [Histoplasma capsulatum]QSS71360.1 hypothetical protein I7I50_02162 [Histoplasma capsulatum G186AR]